MIDLATSLNHHCSLYFSPFHDPSSIGTDYGCASSELRRVSGICLSTLVNDTARSDEAPIIFWGPHGSNCSFLAPKALASAPPRSSGGRSNQCSSLSRSSQTTPFPLPSSGDSQAVPSCLETIKQFAKAKGFSSRVAKRLGFACRSSSRAVYQAK